MLQTPYCNYVTQSPTFSNYLDAAYSVVMEIERKGCGHSNSLLQCCIMLQVFPCFIGLSPNLEKWQALLMLIVIVQMDLNISGHTERTEADKFDCRHHFGTTTKLKNECILSVCKPVVILLIFLLFSWKNVFAQHCFLRWER